MSPPRETSFLLQELTNYCGVQICIIPDDIQPAHDEQEMKVGGK